jgi:prepilin-type N-terminal cleavage/methylation domain-containing protein
MKRGSAGFTVVELIVAMGIVGVLLMVALPHFNRGALNASSVTQGVVANLRLARANATGRGVHFRVTFTASSYTVRRLKQDSGNWIVDSAFAAQTVQAPSGVSFTTIQGDGTIEFDTRGLIVPLSGQLVGETEILRVTDTARGQTKTLQVWPSGQVLEV